MNAPNDKSTEPSSPVCYTNESDATYMGFASAMEMKAFLGELLESERTVATKIRAMLPRVRDESVHAEMTALLGAHDSNVARILAQLAKSARA